MSNKWYNLTIPLRLTILDGIHKENEHPGYYLKIHRSSRNLTLPQLAKEIEIYHHILESIELCKNYPSIEVSTKLAQYFNLNTKFFYDKYFEETEDLDVKLNNYMEYNNISIVEISKHIETDKRSIKSWINKKNKPSRRSYIKLKEKNII